MSTEYQRNAKPAILYFAAMLGTLALLIALAWAGSVEWQAKAKERAAGDLRQYNECMVGKGDHRTCVCQAYEGIRDEYCRSKNEDV